MTHYAIKDQYDEVIKVKLFSEPIEDEAFKEPQTGKWPASFSPMSRTSFKPHYSVETYTDPVEGLGAIYKAQFFVEELEYDSFIVEVVEVGGSCETYMHNSHQSPLASGILMEIALVVEEIETVLQQIAQQHDMALGITEEAA